MNKKRIMGVLLAVTLGITGCSLDNNMNSNASIANNANNKASESIQNKTELSREELDSLEEFINLEENQGFLRQTYNENTELDLSEITDNGVGISRLLDEDEMKFYEKYGWEKDFNISAMNKDDVIEFLKRKTGRDYVIDDLADINWYYTPERNEFVRNIPYLVKHTYEIESGNKNDDTYTLNIKRITEDEEREWNHVGNYIKNKVVVLKKVGDDYQFVSCVEDFYKNIIADYCYSIMLPYYGKCNLMMYNPNIDEDDFSIVLTSQIKCENEKDALYESKYMIYGSNNNRSSNFKFESLEDIKLADFNNDGIIDMVLKEKYTGEGGNKYYFMDTFSFNMKGGCHRTAGALIQDVSDSENFTADSVWQELKDKCEVTINWTDKFREYFDEASNFDDITDDGFGYYYSSESESPIFFHIESGNNKFIRLYRLNKAEEIEAIDVEATGIKAFDSYILLSSRTESETVEVLYHVYQDKFEEVYKFQRGSDGESFTESTDKYSEYNSSIADILGMTYIDEARENFGMLKRTEILSMLATKPELVYNKLLTENY